MESFVILTICLLFVFIVYSALTGIFTIENVILLIISTLTGVLICKNISHCDESDTAVDGNDVDDNDVDDNDVDDNDVDGNDVDGNAVDDTLTESYIPTRTESYDPISTESDPIQFHERNKLYDMTDADDGDFDEYSNKGYIPGYSDVYLYNKDGSDKFAKLAREPTEEGLIKYGPQEINAPYQLEDEYENEDEDILGQYFDGTNDINTMLTDIGSRGDNMSSQYHTRMQKRAKENTLNQIKKTSHAWDDIYSVGMDYNNDDREWWNVDNLYNPISNLN